MLFLNYGYHAGEPLDLQEQDRADRYSIQLYHRVAGAIDLAGKSLLEVGSGRGGGASYVMRYLGPASVVGVDLARSAVDFCREHFRIPGLSFERGDAEALQFPDASFDAILNVESSICYEHPERFFSEVRRVLKPGGHFLYADVREKHQLSEWTRQLVASGLQKLQEEDITRRVVEALDRDSERREALIREYAPRFLRRIFGEFAGVRGSKYYYQPLMAGEKVYRRFLFRKPVNQLS